MNAVQTTRALAFLVLLVTAVSARASVTAEQFYFTAMYAPLGSISSAGQSLGGVYLRWDTVEGVLPADVASFRLERDGTVVATLPATGIMTSAQIDALYAEPFQTRRRDETLHWLDELERSDPDSPFVNGVDPANFPQALAARLTQSLWAGFASRTDFNLARARYRGYLDTGLAPGAYIYELIAISSTQQEARIGLAEILVGGDYTALPAATGLEQIARYGRCDAPESARDHGVVALNWSHPGPGPADNFASGLVIAGYDIYRSDSNVTTLDSADIRVLAAARTAGPDGSVTIPGLEKVNDQPALVSGSGTTEQTRRGWNAPFVQHLETAAELRAAGIDPGDTRAYYIVARDLSGNYGETTGVLVTVPDRAVPPAPYNIRIERNAHTRSFELVWDEVNVASYYANNRAGRKYCNLDTARIDSRLEYVASDQNCADTIPAAVDVKPKEYIVYRWQDDQAGAAAFSDSDGDGFSDADERVGVPGEPDLTLPGAACTEATVEGGAWLADVPPTAATVRPDGRRVLAFADAQPEFSRGDVFWYRIAVRGFDGEVGPLSPPIRGFFPDRHRPSRDELTGVTFGTQRCETNANIIDNVPAGEPPIQDPSGYAQFARLSCPADSYDFWLPIQDGDVRGAYVGENLCRQLTDQCPSSAAVAYFDAAGAQLDATAAVFSITAQCDFVGGLGVELTEDCSTPTIESVTPGQVTDAPVVIDYTLPANRCLNVYRDVDGRSTRMATLCDQSELPYVVETDGFSATSVCLSVALMDDNAEVSERRRMPCVTSATVGIPGKPRVDLTGFDTVNPTASVSLLPPQQQVAGSLLEWYEADDPITTRNTRFVPHAATVKSDGALDVDIDIGAQPGGAQWEQRWCVRALSIGFAPPGAEAASSDWSEPACAARVPASVTLPPQLGWPKVPVPPQLDLMDALYLQADQVPAIRLSDNELSFTGCDVFIPNCTGSSCLTLDTTPATFVAACPEFCSTLIGGADNGYSFVVYRQRAADPGDVAGFGPLIQVSPLIEEFFCRGGPNNSSVGADPFLFMANFTSLADPDWEGNRMVYVDRQPHVVGQHYRYQIVYFDTGGEITHTRSTDWVQAGAP